MPVAIFPRLTFKALTLALPFAIIPLRLVKALAAMLRRGLPVIIRFTRFSSHMSVLACTVFMSATTAFKPTLTPDQNRLWRLSNFGLFSPISRRLFSCRKRNFCRLFAYLLFDNRRRYRLRIRHCRFLIRHCCGWNRWLENRFLLRSLCRLSRKCIKFSKLFRHFYSIGFLMSVAQALENLFHIFGRSTQNRHHCRRDNKTVAIIGTVWPLACTGPPCECWTDKIR